MESPLSYSLDMVCDLNTTLRNRGIIQPFSLAKAESGAPETFLDDILKIFKCFLMTL